MRIAQFVGSLLEPLGGAEQYCLELARWQRDQGHDVTIVTGWVSPGIEKSLAAEGLPVRLVRSRRPYPPDRKGSKPAAVLFHGLDLLGSVRLAAPARRLLAEPWDVVHVHRFAGFGAAVLRSGSPTVMTVHDYGLVDTTTTLLRHGREVEVPPLVQRLRTRLTNRSVRSARLIFPTARLRDKHVQWGLSLPPVTDVIPHGWRGASTSSTPTGPVVFLFLGKLISTKGVELMLEAVGTVVSATELPVTADLEAGYGNPGETTRKAISVGVVGANLEDQMKPLSEAVAAVEAVLAAGQAEGIDFVLNARTDAFIQAGDRPHAEVLADAIERGSAYLAAGAPVVFVPGKVSEDDIKAFVDAWGPQKLTLIGAPGSVPLARMQELGVARVSYGPFSQSVALMALQDLTADIVAGGGLPADFRVLN